MDNTRNAVPRATPARRDRRSRPGLTLIRSRDLLDAAPPLQVPSAFSLAWQMDCVGPVLWPVPAKPGDALVFNEHGIRRHRGTGPRRDRDVLFAPLLVQLEELKRMATPSGPLRYLSQHDVSQLQLFEIYLLGRSIGITSESLAAFSDGPRAS